MALRVPPALLVMIAGLLIWGVARIVPSASFVIPGKDPLAVLLVAFGATVSMLGIVSFRRAQTTVDPLHPERASVLVVSGIYRFTRNPMYLGFTIVLLAWVVYLSAWPGLLVVAAFVAYMDRVQIRSEERALEARFGEAFVEYGRSVRRWL